MCPEHSLGRVPSLELVNFISDGIVEEAVHVPTDEVNGGKPSNLLPIRLPQRAVERPAGVIRSFTLAQHFTELHLLEIHRQQAFAIFSEIYRSPAVRIDDAALVTPAPGDFISVPPEVPELGAVPANNEQRRAVAKRIPTLTSGWGCFPETQLGQTGLQPLPQASQRRSSSLTTKRFSGSTAWYCRAARSLS